MVSLEEQETVIQFNRTDKGAIIYTSDRTTMTKLDKLCEIAPNYYKLDRVEKSEGEIVGKFYKLSDKTRISFRSKKVEYSEEQRAAMAERLRGIKNNVQENC